MNAKAILSLFLILFLLCGVALAGDVKKDDKTVDGVVKDKNITDATKETSKEIKKDSGIKVKDKSSEISKYKIEKDKNKITISKAEAKGKDGKQLSHTKTVLTLDEKVARSIDNNNDGIFGYARFVDGQLVESGTVTLAELIDGKEVVFSEIIINGFSGTYTVTYNDIDLSTLQVLSFPNGTYNSVTANVFEYNNNFTDYNWVEDDKSTYFHSEHLKLLSTLNGNATSIVGQSGTPKNITWVSGIHGQASKFDNSIGSCIDYENQAFGLTHNLTIIAWVNADTMATDRVIIAKENEYKMDITNIGKVRFLSSNAWGTQILSSASSLPTNQWVMVSSVYNGTHKNIYFDKTPSGTRTSTGNIVASLSKIYYGSSTGTASLYKGLIDTSQIYSYAFTQQDIIDAYNAQYYGFYGLAFKPSTSWMGYTNNSILLSNNTFNGTQVIDLAGGTYDVQLVGLFTDDTTLISDTNTSTQQEVNITHSSPRIVDSGIIPYEILDGYDGIATLVSNNANATISQNSTHFIISTGYLPAGQEYYYLVTIPKGNGFVNVPAVAVVIVGAGFVGASFINTWYRRRRNN